jgi:hypothetical protein
MSRGVARNAYVFAVLLSGTFVAAAGTAQERRTQEQASNAAFAYERDTATAALRALEQHRETLPSEARSHLDVARREVGALLSAIATADAGAVRQHYRTAMRALSRVSRTLLGDEPEDLARPDAREHRLRTQLQQMSQEFVRLVALASQLGANDVTEAVMQRIQAVKQALAAQDLRSAQSTLKGLQVALDECEATLFERASAAREQAAP